MRAGCDPECRALAPQVQKLALAEQVLYILKPDDPALFQVGCGRGFARPTEYGWMLSIVSLVKALDY